MRKRVELFFSPKRIKCWKDVHCFFSPNSFAPKKPLVIWCLFSWGWEGVWWKKERGGGVGPLPLSAIRSGGWECDEIPAGRWRCSRRRRRRRRRCRCPFSALSTVDLYNSEFIFYFALVFSNLKAKKMKIFSASTHFFVAKICKRDIKFDPRVKQARLFFFGRNFRTPSAAKFMGNKLEDNGGKFCSIEMSLGPFNPPVAAIKPYLTSLLNFKSV